MLLYILSSSLILLSSSNNIECGYIIYSDNNDEYSGYPLGACSVDTEFKNSNSKYVCDIDGNTQIVNQLFYNTIDCSGEPHNTYDNICHFVGAKSCSIECNTNLCNNFITKTYYNSSDCSGNGITKRNVYLKNTCLGSPSSSYKHLCNGIEIQYNKYSNGNCSGNPSSEYKHKTSCISLNDGTSYKWDGCDDCSNYLLLLLLYLFILKFSFN